MTRARRPWADPEARRRRRPLVAAGIALAALCGVLLLVPGTSGAYVAKVAGEVNSASSASFFSCAAVQAGERDGALFSWSLTQPSGSTTAPDTDTGAYPGTYRNGMTSVTTTPQACPRDAGGSYALADNALFPSYVTSPLQQSNPTTFSLELWFRTTVRGGRLIGFGDSPAGMSMLFDRHLYITTTGRLAFGIVGPGGQQVIQSPGPVADGAWHHAVVTVSPSTGSALHLDGVQVAANAQARATQATTGYWRLGWDNLATWSGSGQYHFVGSMRFAAVYSVVLTPEQVRAHRVAGM
ncbi:LamG domain-containing protein [Clavibacter sp. CT19]|uniref:LamG domain-containing protein n=2 Tax=Clavibacter TaxID=1573 RepID=UPI0022EB837D|nr:LamG domain-containing protein [Clavibacter sp. CT19]MDA3806205.1 LamG domain-containing protein [Clavibacter sp. CT19]